MVIGRPSVVGPFQPDAASMDSDAQLFGMPPEALYLWGTLRDVEGDLHTMMRRIGPIANPHVEVGGAASGTIANRLSGSGGARPPITATSATTASPDRTGKDPA
jgi:hypothetical protein